MSEPALPLPRDMAELIADGARRVPETGRDVFYKDVADLLRPIREIALTDVHRAICIAMERQTKFEKVTE